MSKFVRVAATSELPHGTIKHCAGEGFNLALVATPRGVFAVDAVCPHRGGRLSEGSIDGDVLACPIHGWQFDVTSGASVSPPGRRIGAYEVRVDGDDVLVAVPDVAPAAENGAARWFLVRFGAMGHVGKFRAAGAATCSRGSRVVVESSRGQELGEVLLGIEADGARLDQQPDSGRLLREMTADDAILARLMREGQQKAFDACRQLLAERQVAVELVDAEQLFDGQTLIFYFLGDPPGELADVTAELARKYEALVQFRPFGDAAGAACGTGEHGCGDGACGDGGCNTGQCNHESAPGESIHAHDH